MRTTKLITALIDDFLGLIHDCPKNQICRDRLTAIRDDVFLELPEDRDHLLNRVGKVINDCVPSGEVNCQIDEYWHEVRNLWNEALSSTTTERQLP